MRYVVFMHEYKPLEKLIDTVYHIANKVEWWVIYRPQEGHDNVGDVGLLIVLERFEYGDAMVARVIVVWRLTKVARNLYLLLSRLYALDVNRSAVRDMCRID